MRPEVVLRWTARAWGVASALLLGGGGHDHGHHHHGHDDHDDHDHDDHHEHDHGHDHPEHDGHGAHHRDNNMRAAVIHVMADAAVSVLVIVGLTLARLFHWLWMDPLAGIVGAVVMVLLTQVVLGHLLEVHMFITGALLVLLVLVAPRGLVGLFRRRGVGKA